MTGIGGTGVVTVNQVLGMAALIDGLHVAGLDQTGLSQKGGPVVSDLRISSAPLAAAAKAPAGSIDLLLGFDLLGAAGDANLRAAAPDRTVAVVSTSAVPTGRMVTDPGERFPELTGELGRIDSVTRSRDNLYLDAQALSEQLFGDHMMANTLALGAAYQRGLLPVSGAAIERAIELNGAAVEKNLAAFRWGRAVVAAPDAIEAATKPPAPPARELSERERELVTLAVDGDRGELRRLVEVRVPELIAYQDEAYARRYAELVRRVQVAEQERAPGHDGLAEAVARQLFKLMAYKDEYEVARLHLDAAEEARLEAALGAGAKVAYNLHPPLLRSLGLKRKLELGSWFKPSFRALRRMRRLRGTPLDPFGRAEVRRVERELIAEYEDTGRRGARGAHAADARDRGRAARAAGRDPRLRGREAAQRGALPQARRAAAPPPPARLTAPRSLCRMSSTFTIGGDLEVRRLGYGAMRITGDGIWGPPDDPESAKRLLKRVVELGIDLIDTADSYGPEVSENLIAEALHPYPEGLAIATKGGLVRTGPGEWPRDARPERLTRVHRGQPAPAEARPHRPLPAARARPGRAARGLARRAQGGAGAGQDPPHRRVERVDRGARAGSRRRRRRDGPEPLQPRRPQLRGRARRLRGRRDRLHPLVPARDRRPGPAGRSARRAGPRARRDARAARAGVAAGALARHAADPGHGVRAAPGGERRRRAAAAGAGRARAAGRGRLIRSEIEG